MSAVDSSGAAPTWAERAAERSPVVQRFRARGVEQAKSIVEAALRLAAVKGSGFTTQELVKEAGIALQTFYRYFGGKDQLLLAVIEHLVGESCESYRAAAAHLDDPLTRLRFYIDSVIGGLDLDGGEPTTARFITTEHWRLQALYPLEITRANKPFTDLLQAEVEAAVVAGVVNPPDPAYASWLITQLVAAVFHHYAFTPPDEPPGLIADRLWAFCIAGLSGPDPSVPTPNQKRRAARGPTAGRST